MKKRWLVVLLVLVFLAFSITACTTDSSATSDQQDQSEVSSPAAESTAAAEQTAEASGQKVIGFVSADNSIYFPLDLFSAAAKEATEAGYQYVLLDGKGDPQTQLEGIEDWIASDKVDALLIEPADSDGIVPAVEEANAAGIPVVTVDTKAYGGEVAAHVGSDNYQVGVEACNSVVERLKERNGSEKGTVIVLGFPSLATLADRCAGGISVLEQYPDITYVEKDVTDLTIIEAQNLMEDVLQAYPEGTIDVVYASNATNAVGAIAVQESAGRLDFDIVAVDDSPEEIDALQKDGNTLLGTVVQFPADMGTIGVQTLEKIFNGEQVEDTATKIELVTRENITEHLQYVTDLYKSLEPYRDF